MSHVTAGYVLNNLSLGKRVASILQNYEKLNF